MTQSESVPNHMLLLSMGRSATSHVMAFTSIIKDRAGDGSLYRCPCCASRTLTLRGGFEMCPVCWWEDDGQDDQVQTLCEAVRTVN